MATPTKEQILAGLGIAFASAAAVITHIFETVPDADMAMQKTLDYLSKQFAAEVLAPLIDGVGPEIVAAIATGHSEVRKSLADLG